MRRLFNGTDGVGRAALRRTAWRFAPRTMADRAVRYQTKLRRREGIESAADRFVAAHGDRVLHGPFKGMYYPRPRDELVARLLGRYEKEVEPWIIDAIASKPHRFIDLGASDGYYAVGVKLAAPYIDVYGFELSRSARSQCWELARANDARLILKTRATARSVRRVVIPNSLVLSDIEGAEVDIFTPELVESLASSVVIVELHDQFRQGATKMICERFASSHRVELAEPDPVAATIVAPELRVFPENDRELMLPYLRIPGCRWARFTPR